MNQDNMNPNTLLRLWESWGGLPVGPQDRVTDYRESHILEVAGGSGCWPQTIYRAQYLGYLRRVRRAHFRPTKKMLTEVRYAQQHVAPRMRLRSVS